MSKKTAKHYYRLRVKAARMIEQDSLITGKLLSKYLDIRHATACFWIRTYKEHGINALLSIDVSSKRLISIRQIDQLRIAMQVPPTRYGFTDDEWTTGVVAVYIRQRFNIRYSSPDTMRRILKVHGIIPVRSNKSINIDAKLQELILLIDEKTPKDFGFDAKIWTVKTIGKVAINTIGIGLGDNRIYVLLCRMGWSYQKYKEEALKKTAK